MRKASVKILGVLLLTVFGATLAHATQYPPGPGNCCTDTLSIWHIQNPAAVPHPVPVDSVYGTGGIVIGFDNKPTGFAFYIQLSQPTAMPYSGIDVFTGSFNKDGPLALGDSVIVYGKAQEFGGETEIEGFDASQGTDDVIIRKISSGNPLPPFKIGTLAELQELPTNPNAEQWEGMLVRISSPQMRVARTSLTGGMGTNNSFLLVANSCTTGPCDSVFVDGNTLTTYTPPAVGTLVDQVQGIYNQRTRGYRIQLRNGNDIVVATPPNLLDAYPVEDNQIRVVYDRDVTAASATNTANYSLGSFGSVDAAVMDGSSAAILTITNGLVDGNPESVTASNIAGLANGLTMGSQTRNFTNGVLTPAHVQGPDPDSLAALPCKDHGRFLGTNNGASARISVRGVVTGVIGSLYYLTDQNNPRDGISIFAPIQPLVQGRQYLFAGSLQEFPAGADGETELVFNVYLKDEGPAAIPGPVSATVGQLINRTCDATQSIVTGEDYEGMLTKLSYVKIVPFSDGGTSFTAGGSFRVAGPNPGFTDTITVSSTATRTYLPTLNMTVSVTGIVQDAFGAFRIQPRNDADIVEHGLNVGVPNEPLQLSFAVSNPSRAPKASFTLPRAGQVDLAVFDLAGRKVATLYRGELPAGPHERQWNAAGVGAGMYFLRLRTAGETLIKPTVVLK